MRYDALHEIDFGHGHLSESDPLAGAARARGRPRGNDQPESPGFGDFGLGSGKRSGRSNVRQGFRRITSVAQVTLAFGDLVPPDTCSPRGSEAKTGASSQKL